MNKGTTSDKAAAALAADLFADAGNTTIVISPGSRNAPLIISFAQHPNIHAIPIVDERSAAFFALGIAQQTGKTVALACTSGSAVLNYAPAIAEAYYQKVPLLIITADRPAELIDQGDGQTIRQKNVYSNYIKGSFEIDGELNSKDEIGDAALRIQEALLLTQYPDQGPVHINMPFAEPIYGKTQRMDFKLPKYSPEKKLFSISNAKMDQFAKKWNAASRKLIIAGQMNPNPVLSVCLKEISNDPSVLILSESTSNLGAEIQGLCIDRTVNTFDAADAKNFVPDLLISFGGHVVSKMVKAWLRKNKPRQHWHIDPVNDQMNTYQSLTEGIRCRPEDFFKQLLPKIHQQTDTHYAGRWKERAERSDKRHWEYLQNCPWTDLLVFNTLMDKIPTSYDLHLGNSTPVRYAQLFREGKSFRSYSHRGTSGIDGTVSTAAGAAYATGNPTLLITGDLGFLYDSNALMNAHFPENLRIIIINNGGGGIFRFIEGPGSTGQLETFFEARHSWTAQHLARNFNILYYAAKTFSELLETLSVFINRQTNHTSAILEIFTPPSVNAEVLKGYFEYLKKHFPRV